MKGRRMYWVKIAIFLNVVIGSSLYYYVMFRTTPSAFKKVLFIASLNESNELTKTDWQMFKAKSKTPSIGDKNIFFAETSCAVGQTETNLTARQACAVESAARANVNHSVYLVYTCESIGDDDKFPRYMVELLAYDNVYFYFTSVLNLTRGTVMNQWWLNDTMGTSQWPVVHASDLARLLLLYKYGGIYMDLDFVVVRPSNDLSNFVSQELLGVLANGMMGFESKGAGHHVAGKMLKEFKNTFNGSVWNNNGPELVRRTMMRICNQKLVTEMTPERCMGIQLTHPDVFYPIYGTQYVKFFRPDHVTISFFKKLTDSNSPTLAVHLWNAITAHLPVHVGSTQIYGVLANTYCPHVYHNCGEIF